MTTSGRIAPQQRRSRDTVDRILAAADVEIGERGLVAASTRSIAARAGVSIGALYRFFEDKDDLADALARQYLGEVTAAYAQTLGDLHRPSDVVGALGRLIDQAAALQLAHPGYYRLTEDADPSRRDSPAHQVRRELVALFCTALRRAGIDAGRVDDEELSRIVSLAIETVRHQLVRAPTEQGARTAALAELRCLVTAYLVRRLGL